MNVSEVVLILSLISIVTSISITKYELNSKDYYDVINSRNFTGKVVLVTGSSSGIGEGIAKLFSILRANVVVTGRRGDEVKRVGRETKKLSPNKLRVSFNTKIYS